MSLLTCVMLCGMKAEAFSMRANGRELTKKERKRCCTRAYIWTSLIILNALVGLTIGLMWDYIPIDAEGIVMGLAVLAVILDLVSIKCKNYKYFCASYWENDQYQCVAPSQQFMYPGYMPNQQPMMMMNQ